jgi:hypothetical protein
MIINIEQMKDMLANAIDDRVCAPVLKTRAKYHFWLDKNTLNIGCHWAGTYVPQDHIQIVATMMFHPEDGLTVNQWEELAQKFLPYFQSRK